MIQDYIKYSKIPKYIKDEDVLLFRLIYQALQQYYISEVIFQEQCTRNRLTHLFSLLYTLTKTKNRFCRFFYIFYEVQKAHLFFRLYEALSNLIIKLKLIINPLSALGFSINLSILIN